MRHFKRFAAIMLVVAMILGTAGFAAAGASDIAGEPCEEAVVYLMGLGVVAGYPDGTFGPARMLTRAEVTAIVIRASLGAQGETHASWLKGGISFKDVPGSHWASGYIALAKNIGIVNGYLDGTFKPENNVTYAELAKMLVEAAGLAPAAGQGWPTNYITTAQAAGIIGAIPGAWTANAPATRGDMACMTAKTIADVKNPTTGKTLARSVFGISGVASIAAGPALTLKQGSTKVLEPVAKDGDGNVLDVTFTYTSANGSVATAVGGVVAAVAPGTTTITVAAEGKEAVIPVNVYGPAARIVLSTPGPIVANSKSTQVLVATVTDASGNKVADFDKALSFTSSAPGSVTVSAGSVAAVEGVATVTLKSAGGSAASVISAAYTGITGASVIVTPVAQQLTSVVLTADPPALAADGVSLAGIMATCRDQEGVQMAAPAGLTVRATLSATGSVAFTGGTPDYMDISAFNSVIAGALRSKNTIGAATITGVVTAPSSLAGVPVTGANISALIIGAPYKLAIDPISAVAVGNTQTVKVRVLDVNGNQITSMPSYDLTVRVKIGATDITNSPTTLAVGANGLAEFTHTTTTAGTVVYVASATWHTTNLISFAAEGVFNVGTAASIQLTASPSLLNATGSSTSVLTATIRDAHGNRVTAGSYAVKFSKTVNNNATAAFSDVTVNTVGGIATVTVTGTSNIGVADEYTATCTGLTPGGPTTVTTVLLGAPNRLSAAVDGPKTVGEKMTATVGVRDGVNNLVTSDNGRSITVTVKNASGAVVGTYTGITANGEAKVEVTFTTAGAYTFTASASGLTSSSAVSGTYNAGSLTSLVLTSDLTTIGNGGHVADLSISGRDVYGNKVASWPAITINLTAPTTFGTLGGTTFALVTGEGVLTTFTSNANAGSTDIVASATGYVSSTVTIVTRVIGVAARLQIEPITSVGADGTTIQKVRVTVLDAAGNRVTNSIVPVTLTATGTAAIALPNPVAAVKGQATFDVTNSTAQSVTYTATATGLTSATASGTFTVGTPAAIILVSAMPATLPGNGSSVSIVTFKVADGQGNTVTAATGTFNFEITIGNDFATLVNATAQVVGGQGVVYVQAKAIPVGSTGKVTIKVTTPDIYTAGGTLLGPLTAVDVLTVSNVI
jgi:hypothetical protein